MIKNLVSGLADHVRHSALPWRRYLYSIGLLIGLTLFVRQIWIGYGALQASHFTFVHPGYLGGVLACYLFGYGLQISAWTLLMRYLGAPLAFSQAFQGYLLSFLPRYIPGTIWGYLSRNEWLAQHCGVGYATSSLASLLEATTLLLTAFTFAALYLTTAPWKGLVGGICGLFLWLNWWALPKLALYFGKGKWHVHPPGQHFAFLWLSSNLLYLLFWGVQGSALLLMGRALGTLDDTSLFTGIFSASMAWAIGFLVLFVPTGLGVREATLTALLTRFSQVPVGAATNIALFSRIALVCAELLLIFLTLSKHVWQWSARHNVLGNRNKKLEE